MKKRIAKWILSAVSGVLLFGALSISAGAATGDVAINRTNFPDDAFRQYVAQYDLNHNNILSAGEISAVTEMDLSRCGIKSLKGIEHFKNLQRLDCWGNQLTSLDVSQNKQLINLTVVGNHLRSLDLSNCPLLQVLYVRSNDLTALDVTKQPDLLILNCSDNLISKLDLSKNTQLRNLICEQNLMTSLDVTKTQMTYMLVDFALVDHIKSVSDCGIQAFLALPMTPDGKGNAILDLSATPASFNMDAAYNWTNGTVKDGKLYAKEGYYSYASYKTAGGEEITVQFEGLKKDQMVSVKSNPAACSAAAGKTATFRVTAEGSGLTYQWQYSKDGGKTWVNSTASSATTASLSFTMKESYAGRVYRCVISNTSNRVVSKKATLTLKPAAPVITTQPSNVTVATGKTVKFSVVASGEGLTYQWKVSKDGGKTWANSPVSSAKTATLSFTASASYSGRMYRCVVTNGSGSVTTKDVTLIVGTAKPVITTQPANATAVNGRNVKFSVAASGEGLTYQWKVSKDGGKTWADSAANSAKTATLSFTAKTSYNGRVYRCVITNNAGSVSSNTAVLTVK